MKNTRTRLGGLLLAATLSAAAAGCSAGEIDAGGGQGTARAAATTWPGCKTFQTQPEAQAEWERAGRPASADGDSDGKVCETLPASRGGTSTTPKSDDGETALRPGDGSRRLSDVR